MAHAVQDFLPVFAAGNEGFHLSNANDGLKTVTSPATSKNCIAAGATNTAYQADSDSASSQYVVFEMSISQQQGSGSQNVDQYKASPSTHVHLLISRPCASSCFVLRGFARPMTLRR